MMMGMGMGGGMAFMALCAVLGVALVAGIAWLVLRTAPEVGRTHPSRRELASDQNDPVQVLRQRYAAGEIEEDEYLHRLYGLSQR